MWLPAHLLPLMIASPYIQGDDYLGIKFQPSTYPLCRRYGCAHVKYTELPGRSGSVVGFFLVAREGRVELALSPYGTVLGLEVWTPGTYNPASRHAQFLRETTEKSARQRFPAARYDKCFRSAASARSGQANILVGWHYRVECLTKKVTGGTASGLRISFDD